MAEATAFNVQNSKMTLLAMKNQLMADAAVGFDYDLQTTINYKRNVLKEQAPTRFPKIRYFGIGIKGFANLTSENNISQPYMPSEEDGDLYEPIPFRCVARAPLPSDEEKMYRMRTIQTVNGVQHYCYWLKLIEWESNRVRTTKIENKVETEYSYNVANLNPIPSDLSVKTVGDSGTRIITSVTGVCRVTGKEVLEAINVLYGGDIRRARISELGTYSGVEVTDPTDNHAEAAYVQLATHRCMLGTAFSSENDYWNPRVVFENGSAVVI